MKSPFKKKMDEAKQGITALVLSLMALVVAGFAFLLAVATT
jgi:hypothetical protein